MKFKNFMAIGLLALTVLSCDVSTKGDWSESDKKRMRDEFEKQRSQLDAIIGKEKTDKWLECAMMKMEANYNNPEEVDKDLKAAETIGAECMKDLIGM